MDEGECKLRLLVSLWMFKTERHHEYQRKKKTRTHTYALKFLQGLNSKFPLCVALFSAVVSPPRSTPGTITNWE